MEKDYLGSVGGPQDRGERESPPHTLAHIFETLVPIWEGLGGATWLEEM